jgi:hypothetical protein
MPSEHVASVQPGLYQRVPKKGSIQPSLFQDFEITMSIGLNRMIEEKILKAQKEGKLDNLPGQGKPLDIEDDSRVPEDLRLAYKILKNAGYVPPELEAHAEIRCTEDLLQQSSDLTETYRAMKRIRFLKAKLLREGRSSAVFNIPDAYQENVIGKLEKKQNA